MPQPSTSSGPVNSHPRSQYQNPGTPISYESTPFTLLRGVSVIKRPPPVKGDDIYAMRKSLLNVWLKAKVIKTTKNLDTNEMDYSVEYEPMTKNGKLVDPRGVMTEGAVIIKSRLSLNQLAYTIPCPCQLPVGARVIAQFQDDDCAQDAGLYAGIVAKLPKLRSDNRYLIFFDFGGAQYVSYEVVFLLCASSQTVWNDVHPNAYDFIFKYIHQYPDWPLVKLQEGSLVSVEWNGLKYVARVVEINCALAKVEFVNDNRIEWIFRGSDRYKKGGVLRTVEPDLLVEYHGSIKKLKVPLNVSRPRVLHPHTCSPNCVKNKYIPNAELNKLNPLAIPLFLGWLREIGGPHQSEVCYVAPCGVKLATPKDLREYLQDTDCNLTPDFFYFKTDVNILAEFVPARVLVKVDDISQGKEQRPVQVVNSLDQENLPDFEYIPESIATRGVDVGANDKDQKCCDCTDNCMIPSRCACVKLTEKRLPVRDGTPFAYQNRRLAEYVIGGIVECNKRCPCKRSCPTRVVQSRNMWPLQIFKSAKKGWGVRALHDMPAGSFIGQYTGEIVTPKHAELRAEEHGSVYMANLNYVPTEPGAKRKIYSSGTAFAKHFTKHCHVVDSRVKGNVIRFLNHSCHPNVFMQNAFIDTHDVRFPKLAFFTNKVVKAGSELVFNYNYDIEKVEGEVVYYCSCDTPKCRGRFL